LPVFVHIKPLYPSSIASLPSTALF
jgi:hypothetical protein